MVGRTIGKHQIIGEVGRGGFAAVYKALDTTSNRIVALKVLAPHLTWDETFVTRFEREAKTVASLRHPNIVAIHDVGEADGKHYIAMDYLEGRTLKQLIDQEGALTLERAAHIIQQLASALDYAHQRGVVHRDIKPSNIIIGPDDHVTLTDFGIVKATEGTRLTSTGVTLGTPEYMSPEQGQGLDVDRRSDIYSLGVVLYEMLTGRVPFSGTTPLAVLHKHVYETASALHVLNPRLPHWVEAVVGKALAKDPKDRYSTAAEMAMALLEGEQRVATMPLPTVSKAAPSKPGLRVAMWSLIPATAVVLLLAIGAGMMAQGRAASAQATADTPPQAIAPTSSATVKSTCAPTEIATPRPSATQTQMNPAVATPTPQPSPTPTASPTLAQTPTTAPPTPLPSRNTELYPGMVFIAAGEFIMGSDQGEADEWPEREVYIDAFYIDRYEVTNAQYSECVRAEACQTPLENSSYSQDSYYGSSRHDNYPVIWVSWYDAQAYCGWKGKRLPTEAQWEKAARGIDGRLYPWGDSFDHAKCNSARSGIGDTTAVGQYSPLGDSPYGVADMAGNVQEWVSDWYDDSYYEGAADSNPQGPPSGVYKVVRGGAWNIDPVHLRCAARSWGPPARAARGAHFLGFRCARSPY